MKSRRQRSAVLTFMCVFLWPTGRYLFCQDDSPPFSQDWSYLEGYVWGLAGAAQNLLDNRAHIYTSSEGAQCQDIRTGLDLVYLRHDRASAKGAIGYCHGYNWLVNSYIETRGIPQNSRKQWEPLLDDPDSYFDKNRETKVVSLSIDSPAVLGPDGKTMVSLTSYKRWPELNIWYYTVSWGAIHADLGYPLSPIEGRVFCRIGPEGSDFVLVRGMNEITHELITRVLDLRHGNWVTRCPDSRGQVSTPDDNWP